MPIQNLKTRDFPPCLPHIPSHRPYQYFTASTQCRRCTSLHDRGNKERDAELITTEKRVNRNLRLALHDQVSCGKYCASFYTASFFSVRNSCRKKCLRFLRKKLADVFTRCSFRNISAILPTYLSHWFPHDWFKSAFLKPFFPRPKIAKNNDLQI